MAKPIAKSLPKLLGDIFGNVNSFFGAKNKSETEQLLDMIENDGSGVPMYYAMP